MTKRKLVAIVLALAMILSTFGTLPVFALTAPDTVTVDKDYILTGTATTVKATVKDGTKLCDDQKIYWELYNDGALESKGTTSTGYINLPINASEVAGTVYTIEVNTLDYAGAIGAGLDNAEIITKHDMKVTLPSIARGDTKVISGTVKLGNGDDLEDPVTVYLYAGDVVDDDALTVTPITDAVAQAKTASNGAFAIVATFDDASEYALSIDDSDYVYASGKVAPDNDLDVSVDKDTVKANANVADTVTVTVKDSDGVEVVGAVVVVTGVAVDDVATDLVVTTADAISALSEDDTFYGTTDADGEVSFEAKYVKSGEAKVVAYFEDDEDDAITPTIASILADDDPAQAIKDAAWDNSGEASYKVASSDALNASISSEADLHAGDAEDVEVSIWDSKGNAVVDEANTAAKKGIKEAEVALTGCGVDESADNTDAEYVAGTFTWNVTPKIGGKIEAKITVTFWDGSKDTLTKTIDVEGWQLTVTPTSLAIDEEYNFKVVVTDEDGKPVNRAAVVVEHRDEAGAVNDAKYVDDGKWVTWTGASIDASTTSINDGVYAETIKFTTAERIQVKVYDSADTLMAYKNMEVYGDEVYTVKLDSDTIITGQHEDIDVTAKDADGEDVEADDVIIKIDGDDYHYDQDGEVYTVDYIDNLAMDDLMFDEAGEYEVIVKSADGSEYGKATLKVVDPKVEIGYATAAITDSQEEDLTIKVIDPRDNTAIDGADITIKADAAFFNVYDDDDMIDKGLVAVDDDGYAAADYEIADLSDDGEDVTILAWDDDGNDVDAPVITVSVSLDEGNRDAVNTDALDIAVNPIAITVSPDKIAVDAENTITVNVKDGRGAAMTEEMVYLSGAVEAESETDANGNVTFVVKPSSTGTIYAKVETDREDDGDTVYAEKKFKAVISSEASTGTVKIELMVGRTDAVANGKVATLDVAPFIENGRTMMPFRFIGEALGAKVDWIAASNKVTFTSADGKIVIELTLGSNVAMVNGVAKTLDVPAKVVNGRTVVPVRFVSENMGCYVDWDFATNAITITK